MAGGMNKRNEGPSLADRSARMRDGQGHEPTTTTDCPARHCWVADASDGKGLNRPGLLLEWRTGSAGWEGRVAYAAELRAGEWSMVEEWVSALLLRPV